MKHAAETAALVGPSSDTGTEERANLARPVVVSYAESMGRCTVILLLILATTSVGGRGTYSQVQGIEDLCPMISVNCPESDEERPLLKFTANLSQGRVTSSKKLTFTWTVSAGKITGGQGSRSIRVATSKVKGRSITAVVEVGGIYPAGCSNKASCSTKVGQHPRRRG